ncbi:hypothetical protein DIE14_02415 [Burkholderia sp. Bp9017]|nr:hypothetical protein DIE14_02415 [Burkholderia sp. Bp9017]RQZ37911.1 hypothetical protein DIE13_02405 [Burkholderia sp. Bp9016]
MKNRILEITRNTIPYVKELMPLAQSVTSCLLMQQLDYWFSTYPEGFWKFQDIAPKHPWYKPGTSWAEELGFSVKEFRTAFDNIGVRYNSKSDWIAAGGEFKGKFYACYTDKREGTTWYFRNHALVDTALDTLMHDAPASRGRAMPDGSGGAAPTQGVAPVTPDMLKNVDAGEGVLASSTSTGKNEGFAQVIDFIPDAQTASPVNAPSATGEVAQSYPQAGTAAADAQVVDFAPDAERAFTVNPLQVADFIADAERESPGNSLSAGALICKQRLVTDTKTTTTVAHSDSTVDNAAVGSVGFENRGCGEKENSSTPEPSADQSTASITSGSVQANAHGADPTSTDVPALVFPSALRAHELEPLKAMIRDCPSFARQMVLDEMAGALAKPGTIRRSTVAYARGMINSVIQTNTFAPSLGLAIRAGRESELQRRAREVATTASQAGAGADPSRAGIRILTDEELAVLPAALRARATEARARQLSLLAGGVHHQNV